jgi:hypothetical protein
VLCFTPRLAVKRLSLFPIFFVFPDSRRASVPLAGQLDGTQQAHNCRAPTTVAAAKQFTPTGCRSPGFGLTA